MLVQQYLSELNKIKLLDPAEEAALWLEYKESGDMESRRLLIEHYQPLVFKAAMQWKICESIFFDLIQEGTVGLIEAVEKYDHTRGVAFSLYALHRIRGRMYDHFSKDGLQNLVYIDSPVSGEEEKTTLGDFLVDRSPEISAQAERNFLVEQVKTAMGRLPAKEKIVLAGMYLDDREPKQLAETLDISISHIYRLQKQGIRRVRGMLSKLMQDMKSTK